METYKLIIKKSSAASIIISIGCYVLLKLNNAIGIVLFSFGLLSVCYLNLDLFTGKCGFVIEDRIKFAHLIVGLLVNLVVGYLCGLIYSFVDSDIYIEALNKVAQMETSFSFFVRSILCGIVMYTAVYTYKKGSVLGILLGVPLFLFASFQHSIANAIYLGTSRTFSLSIIPCILGNFIGSILICCLSNNCMKGGVYHAN